MCVARRSTRPRERDAGVGGKEKAGRVSHCTALSALQESRRQRSGEGLGEVTSELDLSLGNRKAKTGDFRALGYV